MDQSLYPSNSGIIMVDVTGMTINNTDIVPGLYKKLVAAYKSNKPVYISGLKDPRSGQGVTYGPVPVTLITTNATDNMHISLPNAFGIGDYTAKVTPNDVVSSAF